MRIKHLFLLACLLASTALGANTLPTPISKPIPLSNDDVTCNLPSPFNFQIIEVGTTWVKFSWAGNAAYKHRLRTYRASDNALLNTTIVPQATLNAVISGLPSGTEVYGVINAICEDDSNSTQQSTSGRGTTLIIDLLVLGFQAPAGGSDCTISGSGSCAFYGNPLFNSYFKIYPTGNESDFREFAMKLVGLNQYEAYINESNSSNSSPFDFKCNGLEPDCEGPAWLEIWVMINSSPALIGTFTVSQSQTSSLVYTQVIPGYIIKNILPERGAFPSSSNQSATANPNPFSETLEVFLPLPTAEQISLQLYSLNGQKMLDQQFSGGQEQYSFSTASLAPGFYFLRIEADGQVQTLKVIKSE